MTVQEEFRFEAPSDHAYNSGAGAVPGVTATGGGFVPAEGFEQRMAAVLEFFPLYELKQKTSLSGYHGMELGLCLLLFVLEKMLDHSHCTYEDCEEFTCRLLPLMMKRETGGEEGMQVSRKLLDELTNRGTPFTYTYQDPLGGGEQTVKFRLLEQRPLNLYGRDTVALRLTEKGLEMLFKSREIYRDLHFSVMQLYLDQQIRRGVFDGALKTVSELGVAVENIGEECRRQRENVRRNVIESLNSADYVKLLNRMEEQLHREQDIFENLKELVRETRQRLEKESPSPENEGRAEKIFRLNNSLHRVAASHLELISNRADLENLVGHVLQDSIYSGLMVRFHIRKEFLDAVLKYNPSGEALKKTVLFPLLQPSCPRLLGPEAFLSPQRLLGRERERPPEEETGEPDLAAWEEHQKQEARRKEQIIALLQKLFAGILEVLAKEKEVSTYKLAENLPLETFERSEVAAFAHLLLLLHQGGKILALLPWSYEPGDEDLTEYAFYRLLKERPDLAAIGPVRVEAGEGTVKLPYDIEVKNLVMKRSEEDGLQPEDGRDLSGIAKRAT